MILTIDIGNTKTKFAVFDQEQMLHCSSIPTKDILEFPNLSAQFSNPKNWQIAVSCVAQIEEQFFLDHLQKCYGAKAYWVSAKEKLPFSLNIQSPHTLGADRLANVAAVSAKPGSWVIIDLGTFLTVDYLKHDQGYMGGIIFPGIDVVRKSYFEKSAQLPSFEFLANAKNIFGNNTQSAMQVGLHKGFCHLIRGFIEDFKRSNSNEINVIATGGGWTLVKNDFYEIEYSQHLTLQGLRNLLIFSDNA